MKKIIGIAGNQLIHPVDVFNGNHVTYTPQGFVNAVQQANGLPLILPIDQPDTAALYISQIDKLLLAGGQDVSPEFYGQEPHPKLEETNAFRDAYELALVKEACLQNKPIFAVCRGMQLLNVALGGTLYQDLSLIPTCSVKHGQQPTQPQFATHSIQVSNETLLYQLLGSSYKVNSYHHQAIDQLAPTLKATAFSSDGLIEGVESIEPSNRILAVQWHPELRFDQADPEFKLFDHFVNAL